MSFLKRSRRQYAVIGISLLLLIPIVMAAFAPLLAPLPSQAAGWSAPPLPERDESLPGFQHLLDPLPLIVRDLPDAASGEVVAIYDATTVTDYFGALTLFTVAEQAVPVPSGMRSEWIAWLDRIMGTETWTEPAPIPDAILASLAGDPRNGDRLSNLAIAMVFVEVARPLDEGSTYGRIPPNANLLLRSAVEAFPSSRGATLNLLALHHVASGGYSEQTDIRMLESWLDNHPDDATALLLLLQLHEGVWINGPDQESARNAIDRFAQDAKGPQAALAHALLGDLMMIEARDQPPYVGQRLARLALAEYDRALELSDDPSIYAARAMALEQLGDLPSAIDAQARALELDLDSITFRIRLAQLYLERRGDESAVLDAAQAARSLSRESVRLINDEDVSLGDIELRYNVPALDGYVMRRPERSFISLGPLAGGRGAGMIVSFDSIPIYDELPMPIWSSTLEEVSLAVWASNHAILGSVILGDADGAAEDAGELLRLDASSRWRAGQYMPYMGWTDSAVSAARMVANPSGFDLSESGQAGIDLAVDSVRYAGLPQRAAAICEAALEGPDYSSRDLAMLQTCIAENAYLAGDYGTSQDAFEALGDDLMVGYVAERRGNLDEVGERYRREMESGTPNAYLAMVRLADMTLQEDPSGAIESYDRVIEWGARTNGCSDDLTWCVPIEDKLPLVYANRGVARLQALADPDGGIDCDGEAWEACTAAFMDFDTALASDPHHPVFLMNKAWAARLLGDHEFSTQLMTQARESDPTLYPVLNDLGVFATESGDTEGARQYFLDATAVNPRYDLALWNLGVLEMREGISGIFRGQAYLSRAIVQNPSLVTESMEFLTDERVYRVEIDEQLRPGAGWTFGAASSIAASAFGFVTVALVLLQATYLVVRERLLEILHARVETQSAWIRQLAVGKLPFTVDATWFRWLVLAIPLAVLMFSTTWIARHGEPQAAAASAALALFAVLLAVVVHEVGHAVVAWRLHATVQPAQWAPGTVLALVLFPFSISAGPFPGQKVVAQNEAAAKWVSIAGPLANLTIAVLVYLLFVMQPLPGLRMISQVQLAAMGYALLPFAPLDGAEIARSHPRLLGLLGGTAFLLGVLFSVGIL